MSLVLDASLALSWYFEDESTLATRALLGRVAESGAVVTGMWRLEVANGLQIALHRKRITAAYRDDAVGRLNLLPLIIDDATNLYAWTTTLHLAERFGLAAYDAAYLELAQRRALPLATLDQNLRTAAFALGVGLLGIVE